MRLIITRHGQTEENVQGIMQGHLPGHLSELGKEQARRLAERLKEEKIDVIYSSDLARAADTAKEIAKYHDVPFHLVKELRERDLGEYTGKNKKDFGWDVNKSAILKFKPKGGETNQQLYDRAKNFVHKKLHEHMNETLLFVGHNGICKTIVGAVRNMTEEEIGRMESLKNTSITIFEIDEDKNHVMHVLNCVKHLA